MQSFTEHMLEYLRAVLQENYSDPRSHDLVEEIHPGFKERLKVYEENVDTYEKTESETLLIYLMKEEFILSGMEEDASIERMRRTFERMKENRRNWKVADLTLKKP